MSSPQEQLTPPHVHEYDLLPPIWDPRGSNRCICGQSRTFGAQFHDHGRRFSDTETSPSGADRHSPNEEQA
jgi:hypothetical protein